MKRWLAAVVVFAVLGSAVGYAQEAKHQALAEELLSLMDIQQNIERSFEAVKSMQTAQFQQMSGMSGEASTQAQESVQKMMDMIAQEMSWDKLKDDYIRIYAETFSEEELQGIIAFYKTPVGSKFIEKSPELMQRAMELSQRQMGDIMPKIQKMMQEMRQQNQPAPAPAMP